MFQTTTFLKETKNTSPTFKKIKFFFQKKLSQELGGKIKIFFKVQMCNIEKYDFRKKTIVDFQENFSEEKIFQKIILPIVSFLYVWDCDYKFSFQQSGFGNNFSILGFINFGVNFGLDFGLDFVNDPLYTWARVLRHGNIFGE